MQYVRMVEVYSTGSSANHQNDTWWTNMTSGLTPPTSVPNPCDFKLSNSNNLKKNSLNVYETMKNQTVTPAISPKTFQARLNITALINNTIQSGAIADIKAFDEVNIQDEFHAEQGSEVHIYNAEIFVDCNEMDGAHLNFRVANNPPYVDLTTSSIEIVFQKIKTEVNIYPNPNNGLFTIECNNDIFKHIKVFDMLGKTIVNDGFSGKQYGLDLSEIPKGIYCVQIEERTQVINQKIVIQ